VNFFNAHYSISLRSKEKELIRMFEIVLVRVKWIAPDIYTFIPMSGCVGMGPSALLCPGTRDAIETALLLLLLSKKQSVEIGVYTCKMLR
jgi:hypothetical protein